MGILTEQNILGNPALGSAVRPGSAKSISDYSFAVAREATEPESIINPKFAAPSPYAIDALFGTVTKTAPPVTEGINGDPIVFPEAPGHYGPGPFNSLPDSQQTNLGGAAEVIAGNAEPVESPVTNSAMTQMESYYNKAYAGPEIQASGAPVTGYDPRNQYYINKSAGATPEPGTGTGTAGSHGGSWTIHGRKGIVRGLGDAPEPPAESTSSAKSNDDGGFNQMDYMSQSAGGGSITPKATVINPMTYMYPSMPPGVGAGTPASPAVGSDEWISAQAAKHGMPLP